jgi:hypothetical protein
MSESGIVVRLDVGRRCGRARHFASHEGEQLRRIAPSGIDAMQPVTTTCGFTYSRRGSGRGAPIGEICPPHQALALCP